MGLYDYGSGATPVVSNTKNKTLQGEGEVLGTQSRGHSIFQLRKTEALASYRFVLRGKSPLKHHSLFWTGGGNSRKCWGGGNVDDKTELPHSEISPHWGCPRPILYRPTRTSCTKTLVGKIHGTHVVCSTQPCPTPRPHPQRKSCFSQKTKPTLFSPALDRIDREAQGGVKKTSSSWASSGRARGSCVWCLVFGVCGWPRRGEARRGEATRPPCF